MHPHHGQITGRGQHRRDGARVALRHVHAYVRQPVPGQEAQGLALVVLGHPGAVAELDAHPAWRRPPRAGQDVLLVRAGDREPGRVLEEDRAELAGAVERLERGQEPVPDRIGHRRADVLQVHPVLPGLARGVAQVRGQRADRGRMLGEQAERLDIEGEAGGGPLGPGPRGLLGGQRVVGGVHLHQRELAARNTAAAAPACSPPPDTSRRRSASGRSSRPYLPGSVPCRPRYITLYIIRTLWRMLSWRTLSIGGVCCRWGERRDLGRDYDRC